MGGGETQQTTQQTSYNPLFGAGQALGLGLGFAQNAGAMGKIPNFQKAGMNPDQMKGFDLVRDMVPMYSSGAGRTQVPGAGQNPMQAASMQAAQAGPVQLGAGEFQPFFDQYASTVGDRTMDVMRRERDNTNASADAAAAGRGAFGGSGAAIEKALNNRNYLTEGARMEAGLQSNAFNTANQLAASNAGMRQSTEMENAGLRQQAALQNSTNQQQANLSNFDDAFRRLELTDQMKDTDLQRQMSVLNALLGIGGFQQQDMQQTLNVPRDALREFMSLVPPVYDTMQTGTQPDNSPGFLQQLLGAGLTIGGMGTGGDGTIAGDLFKKWMS